MRPFATAIFVIVLLVGPALSAGDAGYQALGRGDYDTALRELAPLAEAGDPEAQHTIAGMYRDGLGLPINYARAFGWYCSAARQGFAPAQAMVGMMYAGGDGVERNLVIAYAWYHLAAEGSGPYRMYTDLAVNMRNQLSGQLSPKQIAQAEKITRGLQERSAEDWQLCSHDAALRAKDQNAWFIWLNYVQPITSEWTKTQEEALGLWNNLTQFQNIGEYTARVDRILASIDEMQIQQVKDKEKYSNMYPTFFGLSDDYINAMRNVVSQLKIILKGLEKKSIDINAYSWTQYQNDLDHHDKLLSTYREIGQKMNDEYRKIK